MLTSAPRSPLAHRAFGFALLPVLAVFAVLCGACGGSSGPKTDCACAPGYTIWSTGVAVEPSSPVLIDGRWAALLASEAANGADLNGDGDVVDQVAVRVDAKTHAQTKLGVAARELVFADRTLYLRVDEAEDGRDWDHDGVLDDHVLLMLSPGEEEPTRLANLDRDEATVLVAVGERVFFVGDIPPIAPGDTDLFWYASPAGGGGASAPQNVKTSFVDANGDGVSVSLRRSIEGLLILHVDEHVDGDANADGDALDGAVLAVVDGRAEGEELVVLGRAVDPLSDVDASPTGGSEWTIAFLANEAGEGRNLNDPADFDPAWQAPGCRDVADADLDDDVLHWLLLSDFVAGGTIVNTGLVAQPGVEERVRVNPDGFVGVVSYESDEGIGCDLNADGDVNDRVFRWVASVDPHAPVLPETDPAQLVAVARVPGGLDPTGGVLHLPGLWVVAVDEGADGRDWDGNPGTEATLVLARESGGGGVGWNALHGPGTAQPVGVTWMAEDPTSPTRFLAAIREAISQTDWNGDGDVLDSMPSVVVQQAGSTLAFPFRPRAASATNAGLVTTLGRCYYRGSQADDGVDYDYDGEVGGMFLLHYPLKGGDVRMLADLADFDAPAILVDRTGGGAGVTASLTPEAAIGKLGADLNHDGDKADFVLGLSHPQKGSKE